MQQHDHFVLELLERLFDLSKAGELRLGIGEAAFEILDAAGLFLVLDRHALQPLVELRQLVAIAPVFLVEPRHHLAQLCQIHSLPLCPLARKPL